MGAWCKMHCLPASFWGVINACSPLDAVWYWQMQKDMRQEKKKLFGRVNLYCYSLAKYVWGKQEWPFWIISCIYYTACGREECFRQACRTISCNRAPALSVCAEECARVGEPSVIKAVSFLPEICPSESIFSLEHLVWDKPICHHHVWSSTVKKDSLGTRSLFR